MKIICAGDSLTRAQVSADYVKMLRTRLPQAVVVKAGVNYEPSSVLASRIAGLADQDPDLITVLTGTNDLRALLSDDDRASLRWQLTADPTHDAYRTNLIAMVQTIRHHSRARIALLSPPVIGEELGSPPRTPRRRVRGDRRAGRRRPWRGVPAALRADDRLPRGLRQAAADNVPARNGAGIHGCDAALPAAAWVRRDLPLAWPPVDHRHDPSQFPGCRHHRRPDRAGGTTLPGDRLAGASGHPPAETLTR